jgi:hypothetical protein
VHRLEEGGSLTLYLGALLFRGVKRFFAREPALRQDATHRGNADGKLIRFFEALASFTQGGVRRCMNEGLHERETAAINFGRSAPVVGLRRDTARFTVVLEQPAYTAQTDAKGGGQRPHRAFAVFISLDDPCP